MTKANWNEPPIDHLRQFEEFLRTFKIMEKKKEIFKYQTKITNLVASGERTLQIDFEDLLTHNFNLGFKIKDFPNTYLEFLREAFVSQVKFLDSAINQNEFQVRLDVNKGIENSPLYVSLGNIDVRYDQKLFASKGTITRISPLKFKLLIAKYQCVCGTEFEVPQFSREYKHPTRCPNTRCKNGGNQIQLLIDKTTKKNYQRIKIQDYSEPFKSKKHATIMDAFLENDLVNTVELGDRVSFIGIFKPEMISSKLAETISMIQIHNIKKDEKTEELIITDEEKKEFKTFSNKQNILYEFSKNVARQIYGRDIVKQGLTLGVFSNFHRIPIFDGTMRGISHILLMGDASTGKTQKIKAFLELITNSSMTKGKSSSGVGLTASVVKIEDGGYEAQAGALVLNNFGATGIDEIDKMESGDRETVSDAMSSGEIYINKASVNMILPANTKVFAAGNFKKIRFVEGIGVKENLNMPDHLLSRFDLVFTLQDKPDENFDREMVNNVFQGYYKANTGETFLEKDEESLSTEWLRKYILYAFDVAPNPILKRNVAHLIREEYVLMRKAFMPEQEMVSVLPRDLNALIRLCIAHARLRLSNEVELQDFKGIESVLKESIRSKGYNPITDKICMDGSDLDATNEILNYVIKKLSDLFENHITPMSHKSIERIISNEERYTSVQIANTIDYCIELGFLIRTNDGKYIFNYGKNKGMTHEMVMTIVNGMFEDNNKQEIPILWLVQRFNAELDDNKRSEQIVQNLIDNEILIKNGDSIKKNEDKFS